MAPQRNRPNTTWLSVTAQINLAAKPSGPRIAADRLSLSDCDGKRVAVLISVQEEERVLIGTAMLVRDHRSGKTLRISIDNVDGSGALAMLIADDKWQGEVLPDVEHGCDFLLRIAT